MIDILQKSIIFQGLDILTIEKIFSSVQFEIQKYKDKSSIIFRGDSVKGIKIILKGSVITEMLTIQGNIKKIEELKVSDVLASAFVFGENNFYPVDLIAKNEVELMYISKEEFLKILSQEEKILKNFLNEISNKAQLLSKKLWNNFNNKTIRDKFNQYIRENHRKNEISIESVKALSESFGVLRPSLSRILREYVEEKILEKIARNKFRILDLTLIK